MQCTQKKMCTQKKKNVLYIKFIYSSFINIKLNDIYFTCGLFLLFVFWLHLNEQSLVGNIKLIHDSLLYGKDQTPFMSLLKQIQKNYKNMRVI